MMLHLFCVRELVVFYKERVFHHYYWQAWTRRRVFSLRSLIIINYLSFNTKIVD